MSVSILFRPLFIKLSDNKFIPIIEAGSNNCFMENKKGNMVYSRSFGSENFKKGKILTESEIIESLTSYKDSLKEQYKKDIEEKGIKCFDKSYGWYAAEKIYGKQTFNTTFNDIVNFYKKGIKQAITLEEAKMLGISVKVHYWTINEKGKTVSEIEYLKEYTEQCLLEIMNRFNEAKTNYWVSINVRDNAYDYIQSVCSLNRKTKENTFCMLTNKGFISKFNGMTPEFTLEKENALYMPFKPYNYISRFLVSYSILGVNYTSGYEK